MLAKASTYFFNYICGEYNIVPLLETFCLFRVHSLISNTQLESPVKQTFSNVSIAESCVAQDGLFLWLGFTRQVSCHMEVTLHDDELGAEEVTAATDTLLRKIHSTEKYDMAWW